jgi:hypothetical protein
VSSAVLSMATSSLYTHRMINVRNLDSRPCLQPILIKDFLTDNITHEQRPIVMVVGSSFSWGYSWQENGISSWHMQEYLGESLKVLNGSVIGHAASGSLQTISTLRELGLHVDTLIIEMALPALRGDDANAREECKHPGRSEEIYFNVPYLSYFSFYLINPFGLSHMKLIWDEYNYTQSERKFTFAPLRESYFQTKEQFEENLLSNRKILNELIKKSKEISNRQIIFFSPISEKGVNMSQFDWKEIVRQLQSLRDICLEHDQVQCLPVMTTLESDNFKNVTHLSLKGHAFFGDYLGKIVGQTVR